MHVPEIKVPDLDTTIYHATAEEDQFILPSPPVIVFATDEDEGYPPGVGILSTYKGGGPTEDGGGTETIDDIIWDIDGAFPDAPAEQFDDAFLF